VTRPFKAGVLALGVVGLLALVAIAARGGHPGTAGHIATRAVPNTLQDSLVTLLALTYLAAIVGITALLFHRRPWHEPKESRWLRNFVSVLALAAIAMLLGTYAFKHRHSGESQRTDAAKGQPGSTSPLGGQRSVPTRVAHFQWQLALGLAGLIVLGGVWIYVRNRRAIMPGTDGESLEADMVTVIETTIDDLRRERDLRRAVIAAYAQMERTMTAHGLGRGGAEAPREYLTRILGGLHVRDSAVRTLTELFEFAKFSHHEIDAAMKEQAIDALLAVREDLQREEALAA
jgi:uncharacterized protein DUF4129